MSYHHFTRIERRKISNLYRLHKGVREIARIMGRSPSSISREINRNLEGGKYLSTVANSNYYRRRERCCRKRKYCNPELSSYVAEKLALAWSPEQIAGRLPLDYPDDLVMRCSFSSIYRWLDEGLIPRAVQLTMKLRHYSHRYGEKRGTKIGARELRSRCKEALYRTRFGDWEADTIVYGAQPERGLMLSLVERRSRYSCLLILRNCKKETMLKAFEVFFGDGRLPLKTMTSDRGAEFNCHREFEERSGALFYYTRPASPWQKPTVENTNGLVRQFFPRGIAFSELSDEAVIEVMNLLNNRPRKCLNFKTPNEVLHFT